MKKLTSILTASALMLSMSVSSVFAADFIDLDDPKYDWARDNIIKMADAGLINGYEDGTFKPDQNITKLECIALFARAMGSSDDANADILARAHEAYDDLLGAYRLTWGQDEIVYMLYKGALTKSDLDTYIKDVKDEPMQRYEAAIIITKAMGGEEEAKEEVGIVLDYADANEIPRNSIQYVNYVTEQGIMTGMDDNTFAPTQPVLRSQMATMLARVVDKTAYEYIEGKLTGIDQENNTITVMVGNESEIYSYTDSTSFKIQGVTTTAEDMITDVNVMVTLSKGSVVTVDALSSFPDETITGRYQGYQLVNNKTSIKLIPNGSAAIGLYECWEDLSVTYEGSPATLRSFTVGDIMTLELEDGKVTTVSGQNKTQTISNAKVSKVSIENDLVLTISHSDSEYDGQSYPVSDDVTVIKNGIPSDMSMLYPGDSIDFTLEYGEVTRITATAATRTYEGTIQSLNISTESSMVVKVSGEEKEFIIPTGVVITINGEEGTLYDFRVGDIVTITTESGAITKIVATSSTDSDGKISGVVTNVNTSYGFIKVLKEGSDTAETIYCKSPTTTVITASGSSKSVSDIKVGSRVEARCTVSNGAYTAKLVIIEDE